MRANAGYVLLEIIVSIVLASFILSSLWVTFFQVQSGYKKANQWVTLDARIAVVQNQLDKDIAGAFVPHVILKKDKTKSSSTTNIPKKIPGDQQEVIPLEKAFYAQKGGSNTMLISFVTTNPLQVYNNEKPRIARVTYSLVEKKNRLDKKAYDLVRNETSELVFKQNLDTKKGQILCDGVRSLSCAFYARQEEKKEDKKQKTEDQEKKEILYKQYSYWGEEQVKESGKPIPDFVVIKASFWDTLLQRFKSITFQTALIADYSVEQKKEEQEKKSTEKKAEAQKQQSKKTDTKKTAAANQKKEQRAFLFSGQGGLK